jgi:hypothetical protein
MLGYCILVRSLTIGRSPQKKAQNGLIYFETGTISGIHVRCWIASSHHHAPYLFQIVLSTLCSPHHNHHTHSRSSTPLLPIHTPLRTTSSRARISTAWCTRSIIVTMPRRSTCSLPPPPARHVPSHSRAVPQLKPPRACARSSLTRTTPMEDDIDDGIHMPRYK